VAFFSHRLFISAILRNLYQVKDLKKTYDENGDPMHGYFSTKSTRSSNGQKKSKKTKNHPVAKGYVEDGA
jgi:hypothetical protein